MQCFLLGGGVLNIILPSGKTDYKNLIPIYTDGPIPLIGHARINEDGKILYIFISDQKMTFIPEVIE